MATGLPGADTVTRAMPGRDTNIGAKRARDTRTALGSAPDAPLDVLAFVEGRAGAGDRGGDRGALRRLEPGGAVPAEHARTVRARGAAARGARGRARGPLRAAGVRRRARPDRRPATSIAGDRELAAGGDDRR